MTFINGYLTYCMYVIMTYNLYITSITTYQLTQGTSITRKENANKHKSTMLSAFARTQLL